MLTQTITDPLRINSQSSFSVLDESTPSELSELVLGKLSQIILKASKLVGAPEQLSCTNGIIVSRSITNTKVCLREMGWPAARINY